MELINRKYLLYIVAACFLYFAHIHAGLQQEQNQEHYTTEDHNGSEKSKENDSTYDDINLENISEKEKYRYVVIMFCKAMNSELQNEGKSHPTQIDKIIQELENFQPESYSRYLSMKTLIFDQAHELLDIYKDVLFEEKRPYVTRAHYFRLLTWFKFNMKSLIFSASIDAVFKPRDDDTEPKNLEVQLFPNAMTAMEKLRNECLQITTLSELKKYDRTLDEAIFLFLQLAQNNGNIDKVEQVAYLIPTLDEYVDRQYCEKMRQALEIILAGIIYDYEKFQTVFQKSIDKFLNYLQLSSKNFPTFFNYLLKFTVPEQISLYINEAFRTRCEIKYKRANVDEINLKLLNDVTSIYYLRDTMILYNNAIENKLLPEIQDEEIKTTILQLENFPIGSEACREFQTNTLLYLSHKVIRNYHHQILEYYNRRPLNNSLEAYYSQLIFWAYKQISRINANEMHLYSTLVVLETIWKNLRIGQLSHTSLNSQIDQLPDEISTLDILIDFCEYENSASEELEKQDVSNNDINLKRAEEGYELHHITDIHIDSRDINLEKIAENGELMKCKYVVIMFCKAMNSELSKEGKSPPDEINQVFEQLEIMDLSNKGLLVAEDSEDLHKIFQQAQKALAHYKRLLLGIKRPYLTRARYFRLLLWLKFHTRSESNKPNQFTEPLIDEILKPREDDTHPKNLLEVLLPNAVTILQKECLRIKTLTQLKNYGRNIDEIIYLFLQLAQNNGNIDKVEPQQANIIPTLDANTDHDLCEQMRQSLETVLAGIGHNPDKFEAEFQKKPEEILLYINEAVHIKCEIEYKRFDVEEIDLKHAGGITLTPVQYLHDAMTLYNNAIEMKLLPTKLDEETMKTILQLENFPISADDFCTELQMNTLLQLSGKIILNYHKQLYNGETKTLDVYSPNLCYSRLITWAYKQVSKINSNELHTSSVLDLLENIWKNLKVEHRSDTSLPILMEQSYDQISTLNALIEFCDTGNLAPRPPLTTTTSIHHG